MEALWYMVACCSREGSSTSRTTKLALPWKCSCTTRHALDWKRADLEWTELEWECWLARLEILKSTILGQPGLGVLARILGVNMYTKLVLSWTLASLSGAGGLKQAHSGYLDGKMHTTCSQFPACS